MVFLTGLVVTHVTETSSYPLENDFVELLSTISVLNISTSYNILANAFFRGNLIGIKCLYYLYALNKMCSLSQLSSSLIISTFKRTVLLSLLFKLVNRCIFRNLVWFYSLRGSWPFLHYINFLKKNSSVWVLFLYLIIV